MISALDTNVLVAIMYGETSAKTIIATLQSLRLSGELLICGAVYAELLAGPGVSSPRLDHFLSDAGVRVDWAMEEAIWRAAGAAFGEYAARRRTSGGGPPRRVLADFLIGAHAAARGARLVTLDAAHSGTDFADVEVVFPA